MQDGIRERVEEKDVELLLLFLMLLLLLVVEVAGEITLNSGEFSGGDELATSDFAFGIEGGRACVS